MEDKMAREDLQKEILTVEKIRLDYKQLFFKQFALAMGAVILAVFVLGIFFILLVYFADDLLGFVDYVRLISGICILGLGVYILISRAFADIHSYFIIKNAKFTVTTGILIARRIVTVRAWRPVQLRIFVFESYKDFGIANGTYNAFSSRFRMKEQEFYDNAREGDVFYIIAKKNRKILLVYNTKLFEYKPLG